MANKTAFFRSSGCGTMGWYLRESSKCGGMGIDAYVVACRQSTFTSVNACNVANVLCIVVLFDAIYHNSHVWMEIAFKLNLIAFFRF